MTRVLVCGLAVVDFVFSVPKMPDRPEKYRASDVTVVGGGGGANAAVAIARLDGEAALISRLGRDDISAMILSDLNAEGVDCEHVRAFEAARSSFSSVLVDDAGERQIVNFRGDGFSPETDWLNDATSKPFNAALADTRWPEGARALMHAARKQGVPGVVDAEAPADLETLELASHIAFSEQGLRDFSGHEDPNEGVMTANDRLPGWVAVTVGAEGVIVAGNEGPVRHRGFAIEAVDTLAAGDIWHGAFALALAQGNDEPTAIHYANAAAALKCKTPGGRKAAPTKEQVAAFLSSTPTRPQEPAE